MKLGRSFVAVVAVVAMRLFSASVIWIGRTRMINRPLHTALGRLTIVAAILATLLLAASVASADPIGFDYAENGTAPVARFNPIQGTWGLEGVDMALFAISDAGVLSFKDSPNFENRQDQDRDNVYEVTVVAYTSDGKVTQAVNVTVTDADEAGTVTLSQLQPQVRTTITATGPSDPDSGVRNEEWKWSRSRNVGGAWVDIAGARSTSLTPVAAHEGMYLRATVTYTDKFGSGKTAFAVSENPVEKRPAANGKPVFPSAAGTRAVDENEKDANVGRPVTASDPDGDVLLYKLEDALVRGSHVDDDGNPGNDATDGDSTEFTIDPRTGQIKTKGSLDANPNAADAANRIMSVDVIATDPSTASERQTVAITIYDVNDKPAYPPPGLPRTNLTDITAPENLAGVGLSTYDATDDDATDDVGGAELIYGLAGADAAYFIIGNGSPNPRGRLDFKNPPNFEKKSLYLLTITATDDEGATGELKVIVQVQNGNDKGSVMLSQRTPQVGRTVRASLSDEDGSIRSVRWQWYRNAVAGTTFSSLPGNCASGQTTLCAIPSANGPSYTPVADDMNAPNGRLAARVTYTDSFGTDNNFAVTQGDVHLSRADNTAPKFADDQDPNSAGDQADAVRSVAENLVDVNVGGPVTAVDQDGDLMIYTLSGPDATSFTIGSGLTPSPLEGQIKTAVKLDYETKSQYMVVVTATDPSGASDSINVIIDVTDVAETPTIITRPTVPSVQISRAAGSRGAKVRIGTPISLTATFSQPVTGFVVADITVANGVAGNFAGSGAVYTFDVTPGDIGEVTVDIAAGAAENAGGAGSAAANQLELGIPYDDDRDGEISKSEVTTAIDDYLFGDGTVTKAHVTKLIDLYLFN